MSQRRRRDFYDLDTSHWQLTGAARPADSLPGAGGTELVNERGDWEAGEDLFEKLGGVSNGSGGGDSEEDSGVDDASDDDSSSSDADKEVKGEDKKDRGTSGGGFYEGPEACREFLGEERQAGGGKGLRVVLVMGALRTTAVPI